MVSEIEREAIEIRRKNFALTSINVDMALIRKALEGDVAAIKLYYQRIEGWSEKEVKQSDDRSIPSDTELEALYQERIAEIQAQRDGLDTRRAEVEKIKQELKERDSFTA